MQSVSRGNRTVCASVVMLEEMGVLVHALSVGLHLITLNQRHGEWEHLPEVQM